MAEENKQSLVSKPWVQSLTGIVVIAALLGSFLYWQSHANSVYIEDSVINAPAIILSSQTPGTLNALYVKEGDVIPPNTPVALVGNSTITSKSGGLIIHVENSLGATFMAGEEVVTMINPSDLRVVGSVEENKGLKNIKVGQQATFTVDAFGSKKYQGVVDSISPTSEDTSVVFSISDKRPTRRFDVKVKFNVTDYPELKNGMSAKMTISTK